MAQGGLSSKLNLEQQAAFLKPPELFLFFSKLCKKLEVLRAILERSLLKRLGKREGGDTGSSAALCNYCGSCCIVTIFDRLQHRWIWPHRLAKVKGWGRSEPTRKKGELLKKSDGRWLGLGPSFSCGETKMESGREHSLFNILERIVEIKSHSAFLEVLWLM